MEVQSEQQNNPSEEHSSQAQASVEDASLNFGTASNNVEATSTAEVQVSTVPGKKLFFFWSFSQREHGFFFIADPTPEVPPVENKYVAGDGEGSEDSDEDEEEVIEESPCGRYNKRREVVKYRFVAFIERNST